MVGVLSWLDRRLRSRAFVPVALATIAVSLVGSSVSLLVLSGHWPPSLPGSRTSIVITNPASATPTALHASVLGAVNSPGRYALIEGSRVRDLIEAAGGAQADADLTALPLDVELTDGQTVYVVRVGELAPAMVGGKIDINTASADDLRAALGLTATVAKRIVSYRERHGAFAAVSDLLLVPVSQATFDRIKDLVTV